jgi:hypothetical protein
MFHTRLPRFLTPLFATAALLMAATSVVAQQPRIPPDARGFQTFLIQQQANQSRAYKAPVATPPSPALPAYRHSAPSLNVFVNVPDVPMLASAPVTYVTIKGLDGEVRRFPLARGVEVQYRSGHITLRPGESTTIRLTPVY